MDLWEEMEITKIKDKEKIKSKDYLVREYPLELYVNDQKWITLLCTPEYLKELAIGYFYSEALFDNKGQILDIKTNENKLYIELDIDNFNFYENTHRILSSGCGKSMVHTFLDGRHLKKVKSEYKFSTNFFFTNIRKIQKEAELFQKTGGVHNTLLCGQEKDEEKSIFRADIGRHNAVDKIVGYCILNNISIEDKVLFSSGRVSSEILLKTARAGIPVLASRSAATDQAVKLAYRLGITLISFLRGKRMNIHTHSQRIQIQ